MKQHLLTLGVLAAVSSAAQAQSSVTLYGSVDVLLDISNQGHGTLSQMANGGTAGSRWGLAGTENLGNGYKAIFKLEDGFAPNTGVIEQGGALFGRQAWVGLSGPQGALTLGRQYAPEFLSVAQYDAFNAGLGGSFFNMDRTLPNGTVASTLMTDILTSRTNNSVVYTSPTIGGFSLGTMYAFGGVPGAFSDGATVSAALDYAQGPVGLHAGYLHLKDATDLGTYVEWGAGGTYAIGAAKIFLGYTKDIYSDTHTATVNGPTVRYALANLGLNYRLTTSLSLISQVTKIIDTSDGLAASQNAYVEALELSYQLSKRTNVYGGYSQVQNKHGSAYSLGGAVYYGGATVPNATARTLQLGMRTIF